MSKKDTIVGQAIKDRAEMDNAKIRQEVKEGAEARDKLAKMETKNEMKIKEIGNKYLGGAPYERERIKGEIISHLNSTIAGIIETGKRLLAVKEAEGKGLMKFLEEIDLPYASAWRFMAIARRLEKYPRMNTFMVQDLKKGIGKLYALLNVPDEELAEFDETGLFRGATVNEINKMSVSEFNKLIAVNEDLKAENKQLKLDVQGKYDTQKQYKDKLAKAEKEIKELKEKANLAGISGEEADVLKQFESLKIQGRGLMRRIETANPKRLTGELKIELKDLAHYIHSRAELMLNRIIEMVDGERFSADREIAEKEFYENYGEEAD